MSIVTTIEQLESIYGTPRESAGVKETDRITPQYRQFIEVSPFAVLATVGPEGVDCTPRGDKPGFVRVADEKTLLMPDRMGNNRMDSWRNILRDPRASLLFIIPGAGNTIRVNGRAEISIDPDLLASFPMDGKLPRSVLVFRVTAIYFQCARAIIRSHLWDPEKHVDPKTLPTPGEILTDLSQNRLDGKAYDVEWPERAKRTMW